MLEQRFLGLRRKAYLVTEYLPGPDIIERFAPYVESAQVPEAELQALDVLFAQLIGERISHGDLKGHNVFWQEGRWALIDLDAMCQHSSQSSFAEAFAKDRARFMRNWRADSALHGMLDERVPRVSQG
jgi:RIO-like serine/threonine protein kinase